MNYLKKIGLALSLFILKINSGVILFDSLVHNTRQEAVVRKAIFEYIEKHNKVVFCFDTATNVKSFANMQQIITKLIKEYPDVMFVLVDLAQYKCLKETSMSSFVRLYKNTSPVEQTKMLSHAGLVALLNKHFGSPVK
jgi:hypothetical protein